MATRYAAWRIPGDSVIFWWLVCIPKCYHNWSIDHSAHKSRHTYSQLQINGTKQRVCNARSHFHFRVSILSEVSLGIRRLGSHHRLFTRKHLHILYHSINRRPKSLIVRHLTDQNKIEWEWSKWEGSSSFIARFKPGKMTSDERKSIKNQMACASLSGGWCLRRFGAVYIYYSRAFAR